MTLTLTNVCPFNVPVTMGECVRILGALSSAIALMVLLGLAVKKAKTTALQVCINLSNQLC